MNDPALGRPAAPLALCAAWLLLGPALATAQAAPSEGEELYTDVFGCWNCHGRVGEGGEGQPLRETFLPLSLFVKALRLPAGEMPPFSDLLATDAELATVYAWLEGADPVVVPPPLTLTVEPFAGAGSPDAEVAVTTRPEAAPAATPGSAAPTASEPFRYRLTLFAADNALVPGQTVRHRATAEDAWATAQTDEYGQLLLASAGGLVPDERSATPEATLALSLPLPSGRYVLVVEAVGVADTEDPAILGVGTVVLAIE